MNMAVLPPIARRPDPVPSGGYKVDISRGERIGRVSSEWFSRPDDERYLSLVALHAAVRARAERATARTVETKAARVEASRDDAERLSLIVPGQDTHHAWRPHAGSMVNRKALTSAMIDSRDFLAARRRAETEVMLPAGPKIAFTGGHD